jgi:hypothetical protein|tara:strand:+ start:3503 stop:3700 length:198 start_codon:yes stop_codon:yes gene_type:complete
MKKKDSNIFDKIESIRSKNNKNWMDLLRLSYESSPNKTLNILSKIISKDQSLVRLAKQLKKTKIK